MCPLHVCHPKGGWGGRLVIDCSKPRDRSVNSATSEVAHTFKYLSVDNVIDNLERGDHLSSIDIKDAYRAVQINPRDRIRQGLKWKFRDDDRVRYMVDNRLSMGLASSPFIFTKISNFIVRCAKREGIKRVINYLDDFCIIGDSWDHNAIDQSKLIAIIRRLGFSLSFRKLLSPTQKMRFLGIDIDTIKLELTLPADKLIKLYRVLAQFRGRRKAKRKDLERLGGLLAHCAKVIRGARTFCRGIYDLIASIREPYHYTRLGVGFRQDIEWWERFAARFNGKAAMLGKFTRVCSVYSDASGWGMGATHGADWLVGCYKGEDDIALGDYAGHHHVSPEEGLDSAHINVKEMAAAFEAATRWAHGWGGASIVFMTDSAVVQAALNTGRSRSREIMGYLRKLFWMAIEQNFIFISSYIHTSRNITCDALSRLGDVGSAARIAAVDKAWLMCCRKIFEAPFSFHSRAGSTGKGAAAI